MRAGDVSDRLKGFINCQIKAAQVRGKSLHVSVTELRESGTDQSR